MRITFLSPVGVVGGAERVMLGFIARLRNEHSISVVSMADGPLVSMIRSINVGCEVLSLPSSWQAVGDDSPIQSALHAPYRTWQLGEYGRRLHSCLEKLEPEILHTNGVKAHLLGSWAKPRDARLLWHVHDYIGRRRLGRRLLRFAASRHTAAIAVSKSVAEDLSIAIPRLRVSTVPNFVDTTHYSPGPSDPRSLDDGAGLEPQLGSVVRFGLVATYAVWKGHHMFLDAMRRLVDLLGPGRVRGYVIGGPIYRTDRSQVTELELKRRISELNLQGCVGLLPFQSDPLAVYRALDVVVHASTEPEPFGLTIAEGMACGRAVAAANAGGVPEIITNREDGLLYRAGDATELAKCLCELATNPALRDRLGVRARATIETKFNVKSANCKLLEVYQALLRA